CSKVLILMMQAPVLPVEFYDPSSKRHSIVTSIH
ncbi:hypothetical protein FOCG_18320, partial [Fusarium oxysporum f. sp. radicis-lycopersici 26381]